MTEPSTGVRDAMIVAGGAGTRLWPLTATTPKPLLPFCGAPFLSGVIRHLAGVGVDRVLLVVGADIAPFRSLAADAAKVGVTIELVPEPEPLDTAGGVRAALDRVRGTFLVLNGDILTDIDLRQPIAAHRRAGAAATLVLTRVEDTSTFGVCVLDGTRIVGFVEKPPPATLPGQDAVNAGTYVLEPAALDRFPLGRLSFERTVFPDLVASGARVEGLVSDAVWADLGTAERMLEGHRLALDGLLRWPTLDLDATEPGAIVQRDDVEVAADAQLHGPLLVGPDVRIGAGASVGPHVVLGPGTRVGVGAHVAASVTAAGVRIGDGARVEGLLAGSDAVIGERADVAGPAIIGDGAHLRADAQLAAGETVPTSGRD